MSLSCNLLILISIHAPYKRERLRYNIPIDATITISIHAPYKRERLSTCHFITSTMHFNPRSLQEGATAVLFPTPLPFGISIHAPYKRERRKDRGLTQKELAISIHAPYKRERH